MFDAKSLERKLEMSSKEGDRRKNFEEHGHWVRTAFVRSVVQTHLAMTRTVKCSLGQVKLSLGVRRSSKPALLKAAVAMTSCRHEGLADRTCKLFFFCKHRALHHRGVVSGRAGPGGVRGVDARGHCSPGSAAGTNAPGSGLERHFSGGL